MRALESVGRIVANGRVASATRLASIALVAAACGVDNRAFVAAGAGSGGASSDLAGPSGMAAGGAQARGSLNAAAGSQGVASNPGAGNPGAGNPGSGNTGTSGTSTPVPSTPAAAPAGAGGSPSAGSAGTSAGGVGPAAGGSANGSAGGSMAGDSEPEMPAAAAPCALRLLVNTPASFDDVQAVAANDIMAFATADRPFIRYITFTNRQNAGAPQCELDGDTRLLLDLLSRFVVDSTQRPVAPVAAGSMIIYRIDLRAFGWDVGVALRGLQFIDTWEAMVGLSPYSTEFFGENANTVAIAANTSVPLLFASALIEQVLDGVPPLPAGALAELQEDPELAAALSRISAPVEAPDVAGDFSITRAVLSSSLVRLDPAFQGLAGGGFLDRTVYAPLFLPSLCILSEDQPAQLVTCSR